MGEGPFSLVIQAVRGKVSLPLLCPAFQTASGGKGRRKEEGMKSITLNVLYR